MVESTKGLSTDNGIPQTKKRWRYGMGEEYLSEDKRPWKKRTKKSWETPQKVTFSEVGKKLGKFCGGIIGFVVAIVIVVNAGTALFGGWFEANKSVMKDTAKAQEKIGSALYQTFGETGRLDVRGDCSVRAYISRQNYMLIPYPDRDQAIRTVGAAWCEDEEITGWYLPKVYLRDIETGEKLGSYGCLTGWVSKK
jgi:hypothetical protein